MGPGILTPQFGNVSAKLMVTTPPATVEIKATSVEILGDSDAEQYPLQPKKHSLEFLREIAHLRFRTNTFSAVFRIRHALAFAVHQFFNEKGFGMAFLSLHSHLPGS